MNRTVPPFKKPAFWVILAAAVCVVLGVLLLPHRSGPTQLGTSQAEPTVAYADGTAYAIQLDDQILIRSSSKKWTERDLPSTYIWIRADGSIDTLYMVPFAGETYPYPVIDCDEIQSVLSLPSGKGLIVSTRKNGYYFHSQVDQVLPMPFFPSKDAFPYYPITVSPDEKQVISMNRAPGETGTSLYRYNVDTYQTTLLLPGDPADTAYPMGWLDDSTLLVARRSGYVALTLDSQVTSLPFACTAPQVATVQDGLVVYVDGDAKKQTTLYVGRYADGALTSILEEPNVIPHLTDAPLISPNQTKLAVLCETGAGPLEYRIYNLATGGYTAHPAPEDGTLTSVRWLDNSTLLLTTEQAEGYAAWLAKA